MRTSGFRLICELASPSRPDLGTVSDEVSAWSGVASTFLATDNHLGRATVSSIAVAHEAMRAGRGAIACLNARDRNLLGFRRDLLTAAAYGIDELLLVRGDEPSAGDRMAGLSVRAMVDEVRSMAVPLRVAVTCRLEPIPAWKRDADALFVQCVFSAKEVLAWADTVGFDGPIYPAVIAPSSAAMAKRLASTTPELGVPTSWLDMLERDRSAGVAMAADLLCELHASRRFHGAHVIPAGQHRALAARLRARAITSGCSPSAA